MAAPKGNQYGLGNKGGAPLGNQNAIGNEGGRPREHDREQIAKDLVSWAQLEDSLNLNGFCCTRDPPMAPSRITQWASECVEFKKAYETAKAFLGYRRELYLTQNKLHTKAYDLNAKVYDHFLKSEAELEAKAKLEMDKELATHRAQTDARVIDEVTKERHEALMGAITEMQGQAKASSLPKAPAQLKIKIEGDIEDSGSRNE